MAQHIPEQFINDLLLRVDIVEVIDSRVPLRKSGANMSALCPFHNEKTPSFTVSPSKQFYHCFGCGKHGNAINFLMEMDRLEFVEAIEQLAALVGISVPYDHNKKQTSPQTANLYDLMSQAQTFYSERLQNTTKAQHYLRQRGVSQAIIQQFHLGYAPDAWSSFLDKFQGNTDAQQQLIRCGLVIRNDNNKTYDRFRDRIMFPIFDRKGRIIGFGGRVLGDGQPKYLNSPESPIFHKGTGDLYGLHQLLQQKGEIPYIIIVEGYMDCISLVQHGITNVVATLGTATTRQHLERLFRYTDKLIFCFDGDSAGRDAAWRGLENILGQMQDGRQAKFLFLPDGEDPDSIIRQEGVHNFNLRHEKAKSLANFLFQQLRLKTDPSTIDGRAALSKLAVPLLQKIPQGAYQQLMTEELARQVRIDKQKIHNLIGGQPIHHNQQPRYKASIQRLSPIQRAISFIVQYPQIARATRHSLPMTIEPTSEEHVLLQQLIEFLQHNPHINTATIIQHWQDTEYEPILSRLATADHILPAAAVEQEFKEILSGLTKNTLESKIEGLMAKASLSSLNNEEKLLLQQLIATSKNA